MAKISTYPVDGLISTDDFIIGSDAENVNITKNFTVGGILSLATLQTVLDNGNSATESITLVGNVAATNVSATTLLSAPTGNITNVNATNVNSSGQVSANDVEISGLLYDASASEGNNGQFLKSTGSGILWSALPAPAIAGWNRFDDSTYTDVAPLTVGDGETVTLENDGDKFSSTYGTDVFYNKTTNTILAETVNDTYMITVTFKAAASNTTNGHLDIAMTGPAGYERISETLKFAKGNGVAQNFHLVYQYYADADFVTNGAQINVRAVDTNVDIWDVIYFIQRVQIA
jgi:hypothetical protein